MEMVQWLGKPQAVLENWRRLSDAVGFDLTRAVRVNQVHGATVHVACAGQAVGPLLVDHLQQHHHEAVHRVGGRAVRRAHRRLQRMICAIHQAVTVQQDHLFHTGKLLYTIIPVYYTKMPHK